MVCLVVSRVGEAGRTRGILGMDPQLGWGTGGKASPWMKLQSSCNGGKTIFPSHAKPLLGKATSPSGAPLGVISPAPALQVAEGVENSQNASNFCWIPDVQGEDLGAAPRLRSIQLPSQPGRKHPVQNLLQVFTQMNPSQLCQRH